MLIHIEAKTGITTEKHKQHQSKATRQECEHTVNEMLITTKTKKKRESFTSIHIAV